MIKLRRSFSLALASAALAAGACQTNTPIGAEDRDSGSMSSQPGDGVADAGTTITDSAVAQPDVGGGDVPPSTGTGDAGTGTLTIDYIDGVWTGYFENFSFASGSDAVRLTVGKDAQGQATISVVLGSGTPPAPPTDPTKTWPIALADKTQSLPTFIEGYSYPAYDITWSAGRLQFKLASKDPYGAWCGLQTSYALKDQPGRYNCIPGIAGGSGWNTDPTMPICWANDGSTMTTVPCGQYLVCGLTSTCSCNASGCGATPAHDYSFDLTFSFGKGNGSAILGSSHNVHVSPN